MLMYKFPPTYNRYSQHFIEKAKLSSNKEKTVSPTGKLIATVFFDGYDIVFIYLD